MKATLFICLLSIFPFTMNFAARPKTIMLVLGSADSVVLEKRIQIANRLHKTQHMDKIIVSGGCGAHASSICEASRMYNGLVALGVDASKIYKEENAKTTIQNYVFARLLRDESAQKIIQSGDTVFVVSDHWHAIAVAARFNTYDNVYARFYIEGDLKPKENDKLDYGSILHGEENNETFIKKALWLTPTTSWRHHGITHYLMDDMIYEVRNNQDTVLRSLRRDSVFKDSRFLNNVHWSFIDQGDAWYIKILDTIYLVDKSSKAIRSTSLWSSFVEGLPPYWHNNTFNTGFIRGKKLVLFNDDRMLVATKGASKFVFDKEGVVADFIREWPFSWGKSNVSGAAVNRETQAILLYRNREYLELDEHFGLKQGPAKLNVKWVETH